ncbi:MAG: DUF5009 domain-containing protein [Bryobacteraceae bacterium]|nr:DUF5009 domain-containing protein [Bryobacteraceae bacterium]
MTAPSVELKAATRLVSLDAFRGLTIAGMMLVNNAGGWPDVFSPLKHASWHGWTPTDLVFPFFLWITGLAMTLSFAKRVERGEDKGRLFMHVLRRSALIFLLGLFLNGFPNFDLGSLRIPGVLQRIAVCYLFAAIIFLTTRLRGQIVAAAALLVGYWALMMLVPVPGHGVGVLTKEGNFAGWVDRIFLTGHMYSQTRTWDPEGIVSTLPSIATVLFGIFAGHLLRLRAGIADQCAWLALMGTLLMFGGMGLDLVLPINKNLWTSSYSLFTAGLAALVFSAFYWLVDGKGWQGAVRPLVIYGTNPIVVYFVAGITADLLGASGGAQGIYNALAAVVPAKIASAAYGLLHVAFLYVVAWVMYRKGWVVRL